MTQLKVRFDEELVEDLETVAYMYGIDSLAIIVNKALFSWDKRGIGPLFIPKDSKTRRGDSGTVLTITYNTDLSSEQIRAAVRWFIAPHLEKVGQIEPPDRSEIEKMDKELEEINNVRKNLCST